MRKRDRARVSARPGELRVERRRGRRRADDRGPRQWPMAGVPGPGSGARRSVRAGGHCRRSHQSHRCRNRGADAPDPRQAMKIADLELSTQGNVVVARIIGEVDMSNADELRAALAAAITVEATGMVLDLTKVDYLDSAGIRMLYHLSEAVHARRQRLEVVVPSASMVSDVLRLAGVADYIGA